MEAFSFSSSSSSSSLCLPSLPPPRPGRKLISSRPRPSPAIAAAARGDGHGCGFGRKSVDEDMIVLRKRIRDLERDEGSVSPAPDGWMGWEKQSFYERYDSDVSMAVAALQDVLLRSRPSVALGLVALVVVSVSTTGIFAVLRFADLLRMICIMWGSP